jgi:phthalate 4,5-cis-dihydrodiol dehydrogenase
LNGNQRRLRLGVAGLGRAFSLMLPTLQQDSRIELVAACDMRLSAREQFSRDFKAPVYAQVEHLVDDANVEVVYIASPHQFHATHACLAAARGKHVLVEKPMALTVAECDKMIEACRNAGVQLIVGHCHSFDFPYLETRRIIQLGELGSVRMIQAINYTDFLYRPRRPEELETAAGGGVVFSQAAHQVDIVRLLAGSRATRVRAVTGAWDATRPTEGAYCTILWFENGAFASLTYNGYAHFDSDEWCGWIGELGAPRDPGSYGLARRRLRSIASAAQEATLKADGTYGGPAYVPAGGRANAHHHQHFGPIVVSCERGDIRPLSDAIWIYADEKRERRNLPPPLVPRFEVIDELYQAIVSGQPPLHDGAWGRSTLQICLGLLTSAKEQRDVTLDVA